MKLHSIAYPIVGIAIIAIITGFIVWITTQQRQRQPTGQPQSVQTTKPGLDTSNWKTYTNSRFGYLIKYPQDWTQTEDFEGQPVFQSPDYAETLSALGPTVKGGVSSVNWTPLVGQSVEDFCAGDQTVVVYSCDQTTIGGQEARKLIFGSQDGPYQTNAQFVFNGEVGGIGFVTRYNLQDAEKINQIADQIFSAMVFNKPVPTPLPQPKISPTPMRSR